MNRKQFWKTTSATAALLGMLGNTAAVAAEPALTLATSPNSLGQQFARNPRTASKLSTAAKVALLQQKIKYVFVLFQENRSFDTYFGTYPGANGLVSTFPGADPTDPSAQPANQTASYVQNIRNTDGSYSTISPFLAARTIKDVNGASVPLYPESFYSVDHSHAGYMADFHLNYSGTRTYTKNDGYALDQEGLQYVADGNAANSSSTAAGNVVVKSSTGLPTGAAPTSNPSLTSKQKGEAALAHQDCDTIPLLWHFADVGTLFDNIHQTITGPSTPNAIALISAQSGATQWAEHPTTTGSHTATYTVPNETDSAPYAGSTVDSFAGKPPYGPDEEGFSTCATAGTAAGTYNNTACPAPATSDQAYGVYTNNAVVALDGPLAAVANPQLTLTYASLPLSFMGSSGQQHHCAGCPSGAGPVGRAARRPDHRKAEPCGFMGLVSAGFRRRAVRRQQRLAQDGGPVPRIHAARLLHRAPQRPAVFRLPGRQPGRSGEHAQPAAVLHRREQPGAAQLRRRVLRARRLLQQRRPAECGPEPGGARYVRRQRRPRQLLR